MLFKNEMLLLITVTFCLWASESATVTPDLQAATLVLYSNNNTALAYSEYPYTFATAFNGTPKVVYGFSQVELRLEGYFYSKYQTSISNLSSTGFRLVANS